MNAKMNAEMNVKMNMQKWHNNMKLITTNCAKNTKLIFTTKAYICHKHMIFVKHKLKIASLSSLSVNQHKFNV